MKNISILRLEILVCCIGALLTNSVIIPLNISDIKITYWTHPMVALVDKKYVEWSIFVHNRVRQNNKIAP